MKKALILGFAALLLILGSGGWWWHRQAANKDDGTLTLHGNVDIRQVSLAFDGSGRVAEVLAQEGDRVHAGAVVARLDVSTMKLEAEQARAQSEAQQQALLKLRNGSRPEELAQLRSRVVAAKADAERAQDEVARLQEVSASTRGRGVSAQDLQRASTAAQVARAKLDEQIEALRLAERGARNEDLAASEAQAKAALARVALLEHQIAQGELKAPSDATVRSRLVEPGDMVSPQRPVFALALAGPKWVRVYANEPDLGRVKPGTHVSVTTDSAPTTPLQGVVGFVSPVAEFTPKAVQTDELRTSLVYEVRVRVDDPQDQLRMGQPATARFPVATGN